jgi:predicted NACHT family NTPase
MIGATFAPVRCMAEVEFQTYLEAICSECRESYVQTDAEITLRLSIQASLEQNPQADPTGFSKKIERWPVLDGIYHYAPGHVLLSGRPGSGKSTALRQLLHREANRVLNGEVSTIPVLVELRGGKPILKLIQDRLRLVRPKLSEEQIDDLLLDGKLLLLIDGINEIASDELLRELEEFRSSNRKTPMIFTTRDLGVRGDLGLGKKLEMQPLSQPQMREFVLAYLPEQGTELFRQLQDRLRELCETPLLLKLLCDVFAQTRQIPKNKGELFRQFDQDYDQFKRIESLSAELKRWKSELLQYLAFRMMRGATGIQLQIDRTEAEAILETLLQGRVEAPADKAKLWLEDLTKHHLLQVAADRTQVEFHHQLFQEYYAAEYLLRQLDKLDDLTLKKLYLNRLDWTESLALMLGILNNEQQALRVVELALAVDVKLGAKLAGAVKSEFQQETVSQVIKLKTSWPLKADLLGKTRSTVVVDWLKKNWLQYEDSDVRCIAIEILERIGTEDAVDALTTLVCDEDKEVRQEAIEALDLIGNNKEL